MDQHTFENVGDKNHVTREEKLDLLQAMEELEEKYKTVLLLRFYKGYSIRQISTILSSPEGTVKTHIHRGLALLRKN